MVYGGFTAIFTYMFGDLWFLFVGLMLLNIIDWLTGWLSARKYKKESSTIGAKGVVKKLCYWIVINVAFYIGIAFEGMGSKIGVDLTFLQAIGWFVLANYIVNEIRSVLENCVKLGVEVPEILIKGLDITSRFVEKVGGEKVERKDNKS